MEPKWYVRSAAQQDAHLGLLEIDGTVSAHCGITFRPQPDLFEPGSLCLPPRLSRGAAARTARPTGTPQLPARLLRTGRRSPA
jgi:hypothetical protein